MGIKHTRNTTASTSKSIPQNSTELPPYTPSPSAPATGVNGPQSSVDRGHEPLPLVLPSISTSEENGRINLQIEDDLDNLNELWQDLETNSRHHQPQPWLQADCPPNFDVPRMNILMLVVGSRGDVQPFIALALGLKQYGHRVRIATHIVFQNMIEEYDIEFFDLGGDPKDLMAYMVKNPGLVPSFNAVRSGEVWARRTSMKEITHRCWLACFQASSHPAGKSGRRNLMMKRAGESVTGRESMPFVADAIIANPPSMGHIHCAEKLGVPLHIFFTMPWSPTAQTPHPLANVKSSSKQKSHANLLSYLLVDGVIWQGLGSVVNQFRYKTLDLDPIHPSKGPMILHYMRVPHSYCWSPSLLPRPIEWRSNVAVTGYTFVDSSVTYTPPRELQNFLDSGPEPIYVGFGSIVVQDPVMFFRVILEAVQMIGIRVVLSTGWSASEVLRVSGDSNSVFILQEDCPHDWLFPQVRCVVHHGGAGTTAAGLKVGRPTVIVPFFGDQYFWGEVVYHAGAGPKPIPYQQLEATVLSAAITTALQPGVKECAMALRDQIGNENGVKGALQHFHECLPKDILACSIIPDRVASWWLESTDITLSPLAATVLRKEHLIEWAQLQPHRPMEHAVAQGPYEPISGAAWAITELFFDSFRGMGEMLAEVGHLPILGHRMVEQSWSRINAPHSAQQVRKSQKMGKSASTEDLSKQHSTTISQPPEKRHKLPGEFMLNGVLRVTKAAVRAPGSFTAAMAQGAHNMPRLWGDRTVRPAARVTGFTSGLSIGCQELAFGVYDGVSGLFVQPIRGLMNEGPLGFVKGVGKATLGLPIKFFAAANGIVGFPLKGADITLSHALKTDGTRAVYQQRMLQGEWEYSEATDEIKKQIVDRWRELPAARKGLSAASK